MIAKRSGQALVEFAIISFVLTAMLMGFLGLIVLGLGSFQNNIAAENVGRVLESRHELTEASFIDLFPGFDPSNFRIQDATAEDVYQFLSEHLIAYQLDDGTSFELPLYDESLLVMSPQQYFTLTDRNNPSAIQQIPELNRLLLPNYIFDPDVIPDGATEQGCYRYPGAVVQRNDNGDIYQTVLIPILDGTANGQAVSGLDRTFNLKPSGIVDSFPTLEHWVAPLTIVKNTVSQDNSAASFKAVIFYPSQPGSMISLNVVRDQTTGRIISQTPVEANDQALATQLALPSDFGYSLNLPNANPLFDASTSRGDFGLGETFAFVRTVRPFRRVFETASVFRITNDPLLARYQFTPNFPEPDLPGQTVPVEQTISSDSTDGEPLRFLEPTVERGDGALRLIGPKPSAISIGNNDDLVLRIPRSGSGTWRIAVMAEFEPTVSSQWTPNQIIELKLFKNGVLESLVARREFTQAPPIGTNTPTVVSGEVIFDVEVDPDPMVSPDYYQIRVVSTGSPTIRLSGQPERNWIAYELIAR